MKSLKICALIAVVAGVATAQAKSGDVSSSFSSYVTSHNQSLAGVSQDATTTTIPTTNIALSGTTGTTNFNSNVNHGNVGTPSGSPEPFTMGLSLVMVGTWVSRKLKRS